VNVVGDIYEIIMKKTFDVELKDATIRGLIEKIAENYGQNVRKLVVSDAGEFRVLILVNGIDIRLKKKLDTPLKMGDLVDIVPPIAGG
jgi:MoaD family protein